MARTSERTCRFLFGNAGRLQKTGLETGVNDDVSDVTGLGYWFLLVCLLKSDRPPFFAITTNTLSDPPPMSASTYFRHHPNHVHDPAQHVHRRKLHSLGVRLVHLKNDIGKYKNLFNPNHRHDEPHEQRVDRRRDLIRDSHRYCSFADVRGGNNAKWYVDGRDYFWVCAIPR